MSLEIFEWYPDSTDISTVDITSIETSNLVKDILEWFQQSDLSTITIGFIVWLLIVWIWILWIYFIGLVKEKWFLWAINDLEKNYPIDPQKAKNRNKINKTSK